MKMNEYLSQVTDQIRCQKVHKAVRAELQAHLEDQAEAYESEGMSADEAMEKAVLEMGDPVETGVSLDRVHRPHMEWSALLLVGVIGIFSVILYMFAPFDYNEDIQNMSWYGMRQLVFTVAGYAVMLLVCRLDYSILDRFGTLVAGIVVALMLLATQFGLTVNGATYCLYEDSNHGIAVVVCSIVRVCTLSLPWTGIWMYLETAVVGIASYVCGTYLCKICFHHAYVSGNAGADHSGSKQRLVSGQ